MQRFPRGFFGLAAFFLVSSLGTVQGAPLDLTLFDYPDTVSLLIDVTYDAATDQFLATGTASQLDDDGSVPPEDIVGGTFDLTATIDAVGTLSSGSLTIGGTVPSLGFLSGTLLTGNLTDFGFPDGGGDPLEFLFDVSGGDAQGLYSGNPGGVILTQTGFGGSFDVDFDNLGGGGSGSGTGLADVAPVPLPGTLCLGLAWVAMSVVVKRRST